MTGFIKLLLRIMRYAMPLFYLAVGVILVFTQFLKEETGKFRMPLGIILLGYSVFRTWRIIKDPSNTRENETSSAQ